MCIHRHRKSKKRLVKPLFQYFEYVYVYTHTHIFFRLLICLTPMRLASLIYYFLPFNISRQALSRICSFSTCCDGIVSHHFKIVCLLSPVLRSQSIFLPSGCNFRHVSTILCFDGLPSLQNSPSTAIPSFFLRARYK